MGVPVKEARVIANCMVNANLYGQDSHGIGLIPRYFKDVQESRIKPKSKIVAVRDARSYALLDGNWGFGQVVATESMKLAIQKAKDHGVGVVGILHCGHIGRIGEYPMMAIEKDMIGVVLVNSANPHVPPFGGLTRIFGSNGWSIGIPTGGPRPILFDASASQIAVLKLKLLADRGEKIPEGIILDSEGQPSTDPADGPPRGLILPLGGLVTGHKGYGLLMAVDVLTGALTGAGLTVFKDPKLGNGVFMLAIDINAFTPIEDFKEQVDRLIRTIRTSKKAPGVKEIFIPGDYEFNHQEKRLKEGIYIQEATWAEIENVAKTLGVDA